jgi:hypothetical protein
VPQGHGSAALARASRLSPAEVTRITDIHPAIGVEAGCAGELSFWGTLRE